MPETGSKALLHAAAYDPSLNRNSSGSRLFLEAAPGRLQALLTASSPGQVLAVEQFRFSPSAGPGDTAAAFEEARAASRLLAEGGPAQAAAGMAFGPALLVPGPFAGKPQNETIHAFCMEPQAGESLFSDSVPQAQAHMVYAVPSLICDLFRYWFEEVRFFSLGTALLRSALAPGSPADAAWLSLRAADFDLLLVRHRRPVLFNTYPAAAPGDRLYYTLFAMEQAGWEAGEWPVLLCGDEDGIAPLAGSLSAYAASVRPAPPPAAFSASLVSSRVAYASCHALYHLPLCES
jgi:hypothetical protein